MNVDPSHEMHGALAVLLPHLIKACEEYVATPDASAFYALSSAVDDTQRVLHSPEVRAAHDAEHARLFTPSGVECTAEAKERLWLRAHLKNQGAPSDEVEELCEHATWHQQHAPPGLPPSAAAEVNALCAKHLREYAISRGHLLVPEYPEEIEDIFAEATAASRREIISEGQRYSIQAGDGDKDSSSKKSGKQQRVADALKELTLSTGRDRDAVSGVNAADGSDSALFHSTLQEPAEVLGACAVLPAGLAPVQAARGTALGRSGKSEVETEAHPSRKLASSMDGDLERIASNFSSPRTSRSSSEREYHLWNSRDSDHDYEDAGMGIDAGAAAGQSRRDAMGSDEFRRNGYRGALVMSNEPVPKRHGADDSMFGWRSAWRSLNSVVNTIQAEPVYPGAYSVTPKTDAGDSYENSSAS